MSKRRSIGERLQRAGSLKARAEIAQDWAANWRREHDDLIAQLGQAVAVMDYDALCSITGQIKVVSDKAHGALPRVLKSLSSESFT